MVICVWQKPPQLLLGSAIWRGICFCYEVHWTLRKAWKRKVWPSLATSNSLDADFCCFRVLIYVQGIGSGVWLEEQNWLSPGPLVSPPSSFRHCPCPYHIFTIHLSCSFQHLCRGFKDADLPGQIPCILLLVLHCCCTKGGRRCCRKRRQTRSFKASQGWVQIWTLLFSSFMILVKWYRLSDSVSYL